MFSRTELLIGKEAIDKLSQKCVAIFGIGGVGSFAAEGIARCGVGKIVLIDNDDVSITNINRQIIATTKTIGMPKVQVMKNRILDINPKAHVEVHQEFYNQETAEKLLKYDYDYVVDAIDTVSGKIDLVVKCKDKDIPIISSMGAGNKLDPTRFKVGDIYETTIDPLAKVMRKELRKRNVDSLKVVYSTEVPIKIQNRPSEPRAKQVPGSISFVPSVAGLIIAGEVIKDLIEIDI